MKKRIVFGIFGLVMLLTACGTETATPQNTDTQNIETNIETDVNSDNITDAEEMQSSEEFSAGDEDDNQKAEEMADNQGAEVSGEDSEAQELLSLQQIYEEITAGVELCSPMLLTDEILLNYYNINAEDLDAYVFAMSEDATSAEMVVMMEIQDAAKMEEVKTNLETELSYKKYVLEDYLPEEYEIVNSAEIRTNGSYLWLVVSHNEAQISEIIEKYL